MNTKFTLKDLDITVENNPIKIGELSVEVTDYNLSEGLQVAKELPSIMRQLKEVFDEEISNSEVDNRHSHGMVDTEYEHLFAKAGFPNTELSNYLLTAYGVSEYYQLTEISSKISVLTWLETYYESNKNDNFVTA